MMYVDDVLNKTNVKQSTKQTASASFILYIRTINPSVFLQFARANRTYVNQAWRHSSHT